jgi:hypothetical protein
MAERKTWVLDTETKGTGAQMVPLESVERKEEPKPGRMWVPPKRRPREPEAPKPRAPRRFRVVDVMTRRVLQADGSVGETLALLGTVAHVVDVNISIWQPEDERWRLLTLAERQAVWARRTGERPTPS